MFFLSSNDIRDQCSLDILLVVSSKASLTQGKVSQQGGGLTFCVGHSHRKEAILVLTKAKSNFLVQCLKRNKKHILKTEQFDKGSSSSGRERVPHRKSYPSKNAVGGTKAKVQDPCSPGIQALGTSNGNTRGLGHLISKK